MVSGVSRRVAAAKARILRLRLDPRDARSRYFIGLAAEQDELHATAVAGAGTRWVMNHGHCLRYRAHENDERCRDISGDAAHAGHFATAPDGAAVRGDAAPGRRAADASAADRPRACAEARGASGVRQPLSPVTRHLSLKF